MGKEVWAKGFALQEFFHFWFGQRFLDHTHTFSFCVSNSFLNPLQKPNFSGCFLPWILSKCHFMSLPQVLPGHMFYIVRLQNDRLPQAWDRTGSGSASIPAEEEQANKAVPLKKRMAGGLICCFVSLLNPHIWMHTHKTRTASLLVCKLFLSSALICVTYWLHGCMCVRLHVCSEWDSMLCHRHQETAQLGCLAVAPLYLCSCLCLCVRFCVSWWCGCITATNISSRASACDYACIFLYVCNSVCNLIPECLFL